MGLHLPRDESNFKVYTTSDLLNPSKNAIPFASQLLSVGGGFVIFVALVALLASFARRKNSQRQRRSRDFHSPLIPQQILPLKSDSKNGYPRLCGGSSPPYSVNPAAVTFPPRAGSISNAYGNPYQNTARSPRLSLQPQARKSGSAVGGSNSSSSSNSLAASPTGSNSSGASPQCTPLTPYASFGGPTARCRPSVVKQPQRLPDHRGSISLQLQYDLFSKTLQVTVLACHDLIEIAGNANPQIAHSQSQINPYVKLRVLPDNQHRVKTRVLRGTRNPLYDETFTMYGITEENIQNYSLHLAVLAFDQYSRDLILGEAVYSLCAQPELIKSKQKLSVQLQLKARPSLGDQRGQVLVSMAHNPQLNTLNFAVLKVKDLPLDPFIGLIDPYVKVYMMVNGKRAAKQKTHVKKKCHDAVFNESFAFKLDLSASEEDGPVGADVQLANVSFQLLVLNHDGVTRNEILGQCFVDTQSPQFAQVRAAPQKQIAEWYTIQQPV